MAMLFPANGNPIAVKPANSTNFTIEELRELIGGYVEYLTLDNGEIAIFDEEGGADLKNLPYNSSGSRYVNKHLKYYIFLLGPVLICKKEQFK